MRILLLYEYYNHNLLIDNLGIELAKKGYDVTSFNIVKFRLTNYKKERKRPFWILLLSMVISIPKVRGGILRWLRDRVVRRLSKDYDIIDIHFFSSFYYNIIKDLREKDKKVKITVWGSDFYRVDAKIKEEQREYYNLVNYIQIETREVEKDFNKIFPEFKNKIGIAHFGNSQFGIIDKTLTDDKIQLIKDFLKVPRDKTIISCGTNGGEGHQHIKLLDGIDKLPAEVKKQLFLIIPMNYGGTAQYIKKIRNRAEKLDVPFIILTKFMNSEEYSKYLVVSDIIVTVQISDTLSAAIQEYIYAGNILISGEWLPYNILKENNILYKTTSMENITDSMLDAIVNLPTLKEKCNANRVNISNMSSWNSVIKDWINIYNKI